MNFRFLRVVSGALVVLCAAAPGSATIVTRATAPRLAAPFPSSTAGPYQGARVAHTRDLRGSVLLTGPTGCSVNGSLSFNGGGMNNYPGGSAAGTLAGEYNAACDIETAVGGGINNILGGDGGSYTAAILTGLYNSLELSAGAIIGGGESNIISDLPPYYNSNLSAIAGGFGNTIGSPDSFIGSGQANTIVPPVLKIPSGLSPSSFIGAGYGNTIVSDFSVIGGGYGNSLAGEYAAIGGGLSNVASGNYSVVAGGSANAAPAQYSAVGSGLGNLITLSSSNGATDSEFSVIAGGSANSISAPAPNGALNSAIGGGYQNSITGSYALIGGGYGNVVSGLVATVGGGYANTASGQNATIPGGASNLASGLDSFAAGIGSRAVNSGAFVWSDDSAGAKTLASSASNQFLARAAGGFYLYTAANLATGVKLAPGSGSWSSLSDRAAKTAIQTVDDERILAKIAALPVSEWSYTAQGTGVRHLGPMAQDFRAAFGLGEDEKHISTIDEEGVALAAIKALQSEAAVKDRRLADLESKYAVLQRRLDQLSRSVAQRDSTVGTSRGVDNTDN